MHSNRLRKVFPAATAIALVGLMLFAAGCGNSSTTTTTTGMGSAIVSMSDPPSCSNFQHVYVTVDGVSATTSSSDTGWQELVQQLSSTSGSIKAIQLDLLNLPQNGQCLLSQLGSTQSLPAGNYGQIRLMLVPNNASGVTLLTGSVDPANNKCASVNSWNCVVDANGTTALNLSSQAQTGLKIPPGQVLGGPIQVGAGQSVDINLDFNACRSVVAQGASQFRLDPTLVAYQVSPNLTGISGQVVQGTVNGSTVQASTTGIPDANVALEMASGPADGGSSVDTIGNFLRTTDTNGNFDFCPLPAGPFDVVADAGSGTTATSNATIVTGVPNGTQVTVPLLAATGTPNTAGTLSGLVTATAASNSATSITANVFALQSASSSLEFAVPLLTGSNPAISQVSVPCTAGNCTTVAPVFTLLVPGSNPLVGAFSSSGITWTLPTGTAGDYKVGAACTGGSGTVATFSTPASTVAPGGQATLPAGQPAQLAACN